MAAIVRTQLQQKAINKVTGVMQDYPLGIEFGELMQKTGYKKSALYNVLSMVGASKSDEGLWHLPHRNTSDAPVNEVTEDDLDDVATAIEQPVMQETAENLQDNAENMQKGDSSTQDKPVNMQDGELNTQAPKVSSPDNDGATHVSYPDNDDNLVDIDTDADQSSNGQAIEAAQVAESEEEFELQPPPIATKHYLLIENCTLSLAQDGTGQEPVLAKDIWVDDEGEELEESDCQVMRRAREPLSNWVDFRGVTYRNLFIVNNAQIFHGVFDSIKAAHDKMAELTAKKCGNFFEVLEV